MIQLPRSFFRQLRTILRRTYSRVASSIVFHADPHGLSIGCQQNGIAVAFESTDTYHAGQFTLPAQALADIEGKGNDDVILEATGDCKVQARWTDAGVPRIIEYESAHAGDYPEFPKVPERFAPQDATLLRALDDAGQTTSKLSARLVMSKIQLRGSAGVIAATDGHQLLWSSGFQFRWTEDCLVPSVNVFGCRELGDGAVSIGKTTTHVCVQVGAWKIFLPIDVEGRFPRVESIIPTAISNATRIHLTPEDSAFLAKALPRLPGADNERSPITLDLNGHAVVRARANDQKNATEVTLTGSSVHGKPVRYATNRRYLARAIELGFTDGHVLSVDTPMLFQDERRKFVFMGLGKDAVVTSNDNDLRMRSDLADSNPPSTPNERRPIPVKPVQRFSAVAPEAVNDNRTSNGEQHAKAGFNALIDEAQAIQNALRDLLLRTNKLMVGLKGYRRHAKTMQSTLASLRQLQHVEA